MEQLREAADGAAVAKEALDGELRSAHADIEAAAEATSELETTASWRRRLRVSRS